MQTITINHIAGGFGIISDYSSITSIYTSKRFYNALKAILPREFMDNENSSIDIMENSELFNLVVNTISKEKQDCRNDNASFG